jgi:NADPH:quinone reductase-like Zn-dependent oxidoreductase
MVLDRYGPPEVLRARDVEKPVPGDGELLVEVRAASVNALDWHFLRGAPFLVRLRFGLLRPRVRILGHDFAGRVEAVGRDVTRFAPGDEVFGGLGFGLGAFAEYARVAQGGLVAHKPAGLSFEEAGAVAAAATTALRALRDAGQLQPGQRVLVNGAAGGVGTFSVQIARALGAEVTGVCSTRNLELVRSLGAGRVVDYTAEDVTTGGGAYDLVLDNVGNLSVPDLLRLLAPRGTAVVVGFTSMGHMLARAVLAPMVSRAGGKRVVGASTASPGQEDLLVLRELLDAGAVRAIIDRRHPLEDLAEAIRYVETGHARAKVVVTM